MNFALRYAPQAKEGLEKLFRLGLKDLAEKSLLKISSSPYTGKKLAGRLTGLYSSRITRKYRVIYKVFPDTQSVIILDVSHRKESYR